MFPTYFQSELQICQKAQFILRVVVHVVDREGLCVVHHGGLRVVDRGGPRVGVKIIQLPTKRGGRDVCAPRLCAITQGKRRVFTWQWEGGGGTKHQNRVHSFLFLLLRA